MIISCRGRVSIGNRESGVRSPESVVRSPEESPETFLRAPGSSVALPEMSGKVAGGFGMVSTRIRTDFVMIL